MDLASSGYIVGYFYRERNTFYLRCECEHVETIGIIKLDPLSNTHCQYM
jgi:hypothetical protein